MIEEEVIDVFRSLFTQGFIESMYDNAYEPSITFDEACKLIENAIEKGKLKGRKEGYTDCLIDNDLADAKTVYDNVEFVNPNKRGEKK